MPDQQSAVLPLTPDVVLIDYVLRLAEVTSLRSAADTIGISKSALHNIVSGRTRKFRPRVRGLLTSAYLDEPKTGKRKYLYSEDDAYAALSILAGHFPNRDEARLRFLEVFEGGFAEGEWITPEFLKHLRDRCEAAQSITCST